MHCYFSNYIATILLLKMKAFDIHIDSFKRLKAIQTDHKFKLIQTDKY